MWILLIQSPNEERREFALKSGAITIGRELDNSIVIDDQSASRYHSEIRVNEADKTLVICDLESTNGTFVNGKQISDAVALEHEDQIRIGINLITVTSQTTRQISFRPPRASQDTITDQELLIESIDHYAVLIHQLENQLSQIADLDVSLLETANFVSRSINADECQVILKEDFGKFDQRGIPSLLAHGAIEDKSATIVSNKLLSPEDSRSIILVPVRIHRDVEALIYAANKNNGNAPFDKRDLQLVVAVGHQVALTIQRRRFEAQLLHHANHDPLTRLPNRNLLLDRLQHSLARISRDPHYQFALFFLDINDFKTINDSLGHPVGDKLLIAISQRLQSFFREVDTIARFGGDEFAILYEDIQNTDGVAAIANRLIENLSTAFDLDEREVFITASVGVTLSTMGYENAEDMLRDADIAMYRAKEKNEGRFEVYDTAMHEQLIEKMSMQADLRRAIGHNEFQLYYQPIVSLKEGHVVGLEALIRWNSPKRGFMKPGNFLNTSDTTGLLRSIDDWVLETACLQVVEWQNQIESAQPIYVSVNLSDKQIAHPKLVEKIDRVLTRSNLSPDHLWLEITENTIIGNEEIAIQMMKRLQSLGVHFSLDDFGTGYSTFSYLYRLPVDILKIDRSFITEIDLNGDTRKIVQMLINLASHLGLQVVAEGIEKEEQIEILQTAGCDFAQGYFFAEPMNADQVKELLTKNPRW